MCGSEFFSILSAGIAGGRGVFSGLGLLATAAIATIRAGIPLRIKKKKRKRKNEQWR